MAEKPPTSKPQTATKAPEPMVQVKVVSNYGSHAIGSTVEVTLREYNRLRSPVLDKDGEETGRFTYPILISREHEAERDAAAAEKDKAERARRSQGEQATAPGWAEYERRALDIVRIEFELNRDRQAAEFQQVKRPEGDAA